MLNIMKARFFRWYFTKRKNWELAGDMDAYLRRAAGLKPLLLPYEMRVKQGYRW